MNVFPGNAENVLQVETVHGDVHFHQGPPVARSGYIEQVRKLAPDKLLGREQELAALAEFTTASGPWYQWWRAPAWAGKSALLAWFVLYPPENVQVVSFFVNARQRGQDDRGAFTEAVLEQLAELLDRPAPSTNERHFHGMLTAAAQQCERDGKRLVLVVDGLDEDRGVDGYSIAALLPDEPAAGMRVVVSGRPNPPVPDDVPDGHPLRDPEIVRPLATSPAAEVARDAMQRELRRLLHGTETERDLLGLVTAAGGGLSAHDLAELTRREVPEVEQHLRTVIGRTFGVRAGQWRPVDVFILAHEELRAAAIQHIGQTRLAGYRDRLHKWAIDYRTARWPEETPEFLLRGYYRMLADTKDLPRMAVYATDLDRYERMRHLSGGDAAALADITAAQDHVGDSQDPDLVIMARLAVHYDYLAARNKRIPGKLPALVAYLGNPDKAEALARSITDPRRQKEALTELAVAIAKTGNVDRAEQIVRVLANSDWATLRVATVIATSDHPDRAEQIADTHNGRKSTQVAILAEVVKANPGQDQRERIDRMVDIALSIEHTLDREHALTDVVRTMAAAGDTERAVSIVYCTSSFDSRIQLMGHLTAAAVSRGDLDHIRELVRRIDEIAEYSAPIDYLQALGTVAAALASSAWADFAHELIDRMADIADWPTDDARREIALAMACLGEANRAEELLGNIFDENTRRWTTIEVVETLAAAGDTAGAETVIALLGDPSTYDLFRMATALTRAGDLEAAERAIESIWDPYWKLEAFAEMAVFLAEAGDHDRAGQLSAYVESATWTPINPASHDAVLIEKVDVLADQGNVAVAQLIIRLIHEPSGRDYALGKLARMVAKVGDPDRGEEIVRTISTLRGRADALMSVANAAPSATRVQEWENLLLARSGSRAERSAALMDAVRARVAQGQRHRALRLFEVARDLFQGATSADIKEMTAVLMTVGAVGEQHVVRRWIDQAEELIKSLSDPNTRAPALAGLAIAVEKCGHADHARRLAQDAEGFFRKSGRSEREQARFRLTTVLAALGDLDHAEQIARDGWTPFTLADALATMAERCPPERAKRLVIEIVRLTDWTVPLTVPVWHERAVIEAIEEELNVIWNR